MKYSGNYLRYNCVILIALYSKLEFNSQSMTLDGSTWLDFQRRCALKAFEKMLEINIKRKRLRECALRKLREMLFKYTLKLSICLLTLTTETRVFIFSPEITL